MVSITRYPMYMTGKRLRAKLGIEERLYAPKSWELQHKFRRIPLERRLEFLIYAANRDTGITLSFAEMWKVRNWFDSHKLVCFPMSKDCRCYCCSNLARVRHHVTPIIKGGRNKKNNLVPLCDGCHLKIHPEMGR